MITTRLFYGGGADQLLAQAIGSMTAVVAVSAVAAVLMYAVKATGTLRVDRDGELEGLDIFEHGTPAYHVEFGQGMTYTSPLGTGGPIRVTATDAEETKVGEPA